MRETSLADGLTINADGACRPHLVFASAGDRANIRQWLDGPRTFDLWVTYYGDADTRFQDVSTFYNRRKGSKFQNLHYAFSRWRPLLSRYAAIMVMDDDIHISGEDISRLFHMRESLDLWLLQPAFEPWGKISHAITRVDRTARWRYTNFVEMTCPLFRRDKLQAFMDVYDPRLVGFGADWWYLDTMGPNLDGRVAIVDEITCLNPHDAVKGGVREINTLQGWRERIATWIELKAKYGIRSEDNGFIEYRRVPKSAGRRLLGRLVARPERALAWLHSTAWRSAAKARKVYRQALARPACLG